MTALITNGQPAPTEPGQSAQDVRLVHHSGESTVFTGAELDELTDGLHMEIKTSLLRYIEDYILFLGVRHDKHDVLKDSDFHFGAKYRQQVLKNGELINKKLEKLEDECRREGCIFAISYDPKPEDILTVDAEGQSATDGLGVMVGFTGNLRCRLENLQTCSVDQSVIGTFPPTSKSAKKCAQPAPMVALLAGIVHELLVAHQHDIWCSCTSDGGITHTQVYWFQDLTAAEPFRELMDILRPRIEKWLNALQDVDARIGHLLKQRHP